MMMMKKLLMVSSLPLLPAIASAAGHRTIEGCDAYVFAVSATDKVACQGSYNQFCGTEKTMTFTIGVDSTTLDSPIKRVGFMGVETWSDSSRSYDQPLNLALPAAAEHHSGLFDLKFTVSTHIAWTNTERRVRGVFFIETEKNTYYWLKTRQGGDFEFDRQASTDLRHYNESCQ